MTALGLLLPPPDRPARPPAELPLGRVALALEAEGIALVIGGRAEGGLLHGERATPDGWAPARLRVRAAVDRFPQFSRPDAWQALLRGLGSTPVHNPPRLSALLRDKLACQAACGGGDAPEVCGDPSRFRERLQAWGAGFLKPRFGSFGRGVRRVGPGDPLPAREVVDGVDQPMLLQRAVPAPDGLAGVSLRILVQRQGSGFVALPAVARTSTHDPVVNRARGAEVDPCVDRFGEAADRAARALALRVAERLPGAHEIGVDAVLDPDGRPWLVEVNGTPRGRLAELAAGWPDRYRALYDEALLRPFRELASA